MQASDDVHQAIRETVKAMQIDLWAPLTASECDLVKRALAPVVMAVEEQSAAS